MKDYRLVEAGLTGNDVPVFKFETELHDGADLDGNFHIQFAAAQKGEEKRFVVNSPQGILAIFDNGDSRTVAQALAEAGEYIVCANYENTSWEEPGAIATVLMGRDIGQDMDYRERYELAQKELESVKEISATLSVAEDD